MWEQDSSHPQNCGDCHMKNKKNIFFAIITKLISQENIKKAQIQKEEFLRKDDGISGPIKIGKQSSFFFQIHTGSVIDQWRKVVVKLWTLFCTFRD